MGIFSVCTDNLNAQGLSLWWLSQVNHRDIGQNDELIFKNYYGKTKYGLGLILIGME